MTDDQINAMSELAGRHTAEKTRLAYKYNGEIQTLLDSQADEMRALAVNLGLAGPGVDIAPEFPADGIPADAPVGVPLPYEAPTLTPMPPGYVPPGGFPPGVGPQRPVSTTPMPRPLKFRK